MKPELLVTAGQHTAVNMFPGLVHTARHVMKAGNTRSRWANPQGGQPSKVRLDHLLSREIRVSTLGGVEALMAPRVDRTVARASPPGGARRVRSARIEAGGR